MDRWLMKRYIAYYIAFGAHGPRALPPPGEGWKVAGYTALGVGISFAVFVAIRMFAKGSPGTMNKEYQEATNEYLKVCLLLPYYIIFWGGERGEGGNAKGKGKREGREKGKRGRGANIMAIEPKLRPHLRYLVRKLQGQGNGAEPAEEEGISLPAASTFPLINYSVLVRAKPFDFSFVSRSGGRNGLGWVVHID